MKLVATEIIPFVNSSFFIEKRERNFFSSPFHTQPSYHYHPEIELVYIIEGYGKRIIGDNVNSFNSGDLVFIGSNIPHIWLSDQKFYQENTMLNSRSIVAYLTPKIFTESLNHIVELTHIKALVEQPYFCMQVIGTTRDLVGKKLEACIQKSGFHKFNEMLQILNILSTTTDKINLTTDTISPAADGFQWEDRIIEIIKFIQDNFSKRITLTEISEKACMTEQSFSRYFRSRINKTFSEYLLEQRMSHGTRLLIETHKSISEVAYLCGYNSPSRFCQLFKKQYGISPLQKRSAFRENISLPS